MSANPTPTPGLHRVEERRRPFGIATKITGRNTASVSYIVSLEAERRTVPLVLATAFGPTGELKGMAVAEFDSVGACVSAIDLHSGEYLVLPHNSDEAYVLTEDQYNSEFERRD